MTTSFEPTPLRLSWEPWPQQLGRCQTQGADRCAISQAVCKVLLRVVGFLFKTREPNSVRAALKGQFQRDAEKAMPTKDIQLHTRTYLQVDAAPATNDHERLQDF